MRRSPFNSTSLRPPPPPSLPSNPPSLPQHHNSACCGHLFGLDTILFHFDHIQTEKWSNVLSRIDYDCRWMIPAPMSNYEAYCGGSSKIRVWLAGVSFLQICLYLPLILVITLFETLSLLLIKLIAIFCVIADTILAIFFAMALFCYISNIGDSGNVQCVHWWKSELFIHVA